MYGLCLQTAEHFLLFMIEEMRFYDQCNDYELSNVS